MTAPNVPNPPTPSPEQTATPAPSGPAGQPWTAPANHPIEAFRGKSATEILSYAERLAAAVPPTPAPTPVASAAPVMPTDDDIINRPREAVGMIADARLQSALNPVNQALQNFASMQASTMRMLAEQRFGDDFKRWGAEIDGLMQSAAPEQRTLDNYERVVKYVRGNHMDELVTDRARAMMATGSLGERSMGSNGLPVGNPGGLEVEKLHPGAQELMRKHNVNEQVVRDFCKVNGWTVERWMSEAQNGKVFTQDTPFSFTMKDESLGITRQFEG